jgi:hypothetical protein
VQNSAVSWTRKIFVVVQNRNPVNYVPWSWRSEAVIVAVIVAASYSIPLRYINIGSPISFTHRCKKSIKTHSIDHTKCVRDLAARSPAQGKERTVRHSTSPASLGLEKDCRFHSYCFLWWVGCSVDQKSSVAIQGIQDEGNSSFAILQPETFLLARRTVPITASVATPYWSEIAVGFR